jgi:hypothetical protein
MVTVKKINLLFEMKKRILLVVLFFSFGICSAQKVIDAKLLQGKWQSVEDKTNFLIFTKNLRKEIASGMDSWDISNYNLSKGPDNSIYINEVFDNEKVSVWGIESLDNTKLTLIYLARGNFLRYRRVK